MDKLRPLNPSCIALLNFLKRPQHELTRTSTVRLFASQTSPISSILSHLSISQSSNGRLDLGYSKNDSPLRNFTAFEGRLELLGPSYTCQQAAEDVYATTPQHLSVNHKILASVASITLCLVFLSICYQSVHRALQLTSAPSTSTNKELQECMDVTLQAWKGYGLGDRRFNLQVTIEECERRSNELCTLDAREIEVRRLKAMRKVELWQNTTGGILYPNVPQLMFIRAEPSVEMRALGPHTWVVLIAINTYEDPGLGDLRGPESDADKLKSYFLEYLDVPESHICVVKNEAATRAGILDVLYGHLRDNDKIADGDNLVIWFGGHGIRYPGSDATGREYMALCPADRGSKTDDGLVPDISCREFNIIVKEIRQEKSPHITVILDCCHAAGAARGFPPDVQPVDIHPRLPLEAADRDPRRRDSRKANCSTWEVDRTTHVLLCSSQEGERSFEAQSLSSGRSSGRFTTAFLAVLQSPDVQTMSVTYEDAIERIGPLGVGPEPQTPVVFGKYKASRIWFTDVASYRLSTIDQ